MTSNMSGAHRIVMYIGAASISAFGILRAVRYYNIWKRAELVKRTHTEGQKEEIKSLNGSLQHCQTLLEEERRTVTSLREETVLLNKTVREAETKLDSMRKQNQILGNRANGLTLQTRQLEAELQKRIWEQKELKELLDTKNGELKGAQVFLTKADQFAGGDVIKLVERLNAEILQTAASMSEELTIEEKKVDAGGKEQESDERNVAISRSEEVIGPRLTDLLKTSEHYQDAILVQTALQTGMAAYTHWMISSWCFESPEDEHMLSEIYARVREAEEQAVSGRWRQLTRSHLKRMLSHEPELLSDLAEVLANILVAAGYKGGPIVAFQRIMARFSNSIGTLISLARDLHKSVGEGVTSSDLEVLYISPDIQFRAANMQDALGDTLADVNERVICTTDLGLVRAERLSGKVAHWNEIVLLKPKVILPSSLVGVVGSMDIL